MVLLEQFLRELPEIGDLCYQGLDLVGLDLLEVNVLLVVSRVELVVSLLRILVVPEDQVNP